MAFIVNKLALPSPAAAANRDPVTQYGQRKLQLALASKVITKG
jgi:hypothetical protein